MAHHPWGFSKGIHFLQWKDTPSKGWKSRNILLNPPKDLESAHKQRKGRNKSVLRQRIMMYLFILGKVSRWGKLLIQQIGSWLGVYEGVPIHLPSFNSGSWRYGGTYYLSYRLLPLWCEAGLLFTFSGLIIHLGFSPSTSTSNPLQSC